MALRTENKLLNRIGKEIKYCRAWVESSNNKCTKKVILGTNYCWWHYPKKVPIISLIFGAILGLLVSLFFKEPLTQIFSKIPILHYIDKSMPKIEKKTPDIETSKVLDKNIKDFDVLFSDKDSGIDVSKSYIKVSYKEKNMYKPLRGKLDKTNSNLHLTLDKELKYGEYLFEVTLVDNANNKNEYRTPFVVRENDELIAFVNYDTYENASDSDRKIFNSFFESKIKEHLEFFNFYIYKLSISNKDHAAVLKNLYLTVDMPDMFFCWEQIGNLNAKRVDIYGSAAESFDKRSRGSIYINNNLLNIEEIGPNGFVIFLILGGRSKLLPKSEEEVWEGFDIYGTYLSEGYGSSESRKVQLRVPKKDFKPLRE